MTRDLIDQEAAFAARFARMDATLEHLRRQSAPLSRRERLRIAIVWTLFVSATFGLGVFFGVSVVAS